MAGAAAAAAAASAASHRWGTFDDPDVLIAKGLQTCPCHHPDAEKCGDVCQDCGFLVEWRHHRYDEKCYASVSNQCVDESAAAAAGGGGSSSSSSKSKKKKPKKKKRKTNAAERIKCCTCNVEYCDDRCHAAVY